MAVSLSPTCGGRRACGGSRAGESPHLVAEGSSARHEWGRAGRVRAAGCAPDRSAFPMVSASG